MNRKLIITVVVALVVIVGGVLALASLRKPAPAPPPKNEDITLTYWRAVDESDSFKQVIEDFQKNNPKVKIDYKKIPLAEYETQLLNALANGKGPDMFSVGNAWMPKYFEKLTPAPDEVVTVDAYKNTFYPIAAEDNIKDNKIYGMPYHVDTLAMYVNSQLLDRSEITIPPKTWDDLVGKAADPSRPSDPGKPGMLKKLNVRPNNGPTFTQSAIAMGNSKVQRAQDLLSLTMLQRQTAMVNGNRDQATYNLTQKVQDKELHQGTEALRFYTSFADPKHPNYSWNAAQGDSVDAFAQGKVAFMIGYAYNIPVIERKNPNLKFSIEPVPQIEGTEEVNYANYWSEVVSRNSQHSKEAWEFIKFVTEKENIGELSEATKKVPSRKDIGAGQSRLDVFKTQAERAKGWYQGDYAKADTIFIEMIVQVLSGEAHQRAIDNAANRQTQVLKDLKNGTTTNDTGKPDNPAGL